MTSASSVLVRDLPAEARDAFVLRGHKARHFFPHRVIRVLKGGVDGLKLARRMKGDVGVDQLRQLVLYALPPAVDEFPQEIFYDEELVWHQQHFGLPGHVATASIVLDGTDVFVTTLIADVVQRIGRRRDLKTRIENRFKGWARLLVHAVLDLAVDVGARRVLIADAGLAYEHTDRARDVKRPLFDWVYDHSVGPPYLAEKAGRWWELDVGANAPRLLRPCRSAHALPARPDVYVCHDIERGWGHVNDDPAFAVDAERNAPRHLTRMLEAEGVQQAHATYSIVGMLMRELAPVVQGHGHSVAFHSFDHADPDEPHADDQLGRCRAVDYRIKGYRPAQSRLGPELDDSNLAFHNFEWLASSAFSLGIARPVLQHGVVRIPIAFDDFDLYRGTPYADWEVTALAGVRHAVERDDPAVFSLHDCYGAAWLPNYPSLLRAISTLGTFGTLDQLAANMLLQAAT